MTLTSGLLAGLAASGVLILDEHDGVPHAELVSEIGDKRNCDAALKALS